MIKDVFDEINAMKGKSREELLRQLSQLIKQIYTRFQDKEFRKNVPENTIFQIMKLMMIAQKRLGE